MTSRRRSPQKAGLDDSFNHIQVNNNKRARHEFASNGNSSGPAIIKYLDEVTHGAESLNQRMRELLSLAANNNIDAEHAQAWNKMTSAVGEFVKNATAIAELTPTPAAAAATTPPRTTPPPTTTTPTGTPPPSAFDPPKTPPMATAASSPPTYSTGTTPTKRAPSEEEEESPAPKKQKRDLFADAADFSSCAGPPKRRFSDFSEASPGGAMKKRTKNNHKEGVERPALAGRKRGAGDDFVQWREDVRMKKGRPGYFQDGDPPMEYEEDSSDDEEDQPGDDPVVLSSDEGEEEEEL